MQPTHSETDDDGTDDDAAQHSTDDHSPDGTAGNGDTDTSDGQPVHELGALHEGDRVELSDRPEPLVVIDARVQHARLRGPQDGEHTVSDWQAADTDTGEFRTGDGRVVHVHCLGRADGTTPEHAIGQEFDRSTQPTGGLSTSFVSGSDL